MPYFPSIPLPSGFLKKFLEAFFTYTTTTNPGICLFLFDRVPGVTIATDLICGFPSETEEDFDGTMQLVEEYKFPSLFINQFFPRPGTPAAKMERIPPPIVKQRTKRVSELFQSYHPYDHKVCLLSNLCRKMTRTELWRMVLKWYRIFPPFMGMSRLCTW